VEEEKRRSREAKPASSRIRFGPYELDLRSAELRKDELRIHLQDQPFRILVALLERPGDVVLRKEIRNKLWPDSVVDFDHGINAAVKRLRDALCESAEKPRYIETLARKGYRFIGKIEVEQNSLTESSVAGQEDVVAPLVGPLVKPVEHALTSLKQPDLGDHLSNLEGQPVNRPFHRAERNSWWIAASILAIIVLGAVICVTSLTSFGVKPAPEMRRLTFDSGLTTDPAASPDGKLLAYASDRNGSGALHLWMQQFIPDGQAVQLTRGEADDHQPAFSPDGRSVAFRSERDGGGIWVIPVIGGDATLIVRGGRDPRFSPDGRWIAYWRPSTMAAPFVASAGRVYVVPSTGGPPRPVLSDLTEAGVPEWSPDSKSLIVYGRKDDLPPPVGRWNWWLVPIDGGLATSTDAFSLLKAKRFDGTARSDAPRVGVWRGNDLLFSARRGDNTNVWKIHIDTSTSRVSGEPQQLTSSTGLDAYPGLTEDGRLLFAGLVNSSDVWILPVDTNSGKTTGQLKRVTDTVGPHQFASLSTDGKLLAYSSVRYGQPRAWIKNLESGIAKPLSISTSGQCITQLSSDGKLLVYTTCDENGAGFVVPVQGGHADQVCSNCTTAYDLSPDNKVVLYRKGNAMRAFSLASRRDSLFMQSNKYHVFQHKFSPDGRWITFEAVQGNQSRLYIAALQNGVSSTPENEWIPVTGDEGWADKPRWSPDGNLIYFISNRDGFFCVWAQQVVSGSKQPTGAPISIAHFHGSRLSIENVGVGRPMEISVAKDKIALNLGELTGNIWAAGLFR
jgi:eukaryotic-like serine/threonine-protein kinase